VSDEEGQRERAPIARRPTTPATGPSSTSCCPARDGSEVSRITLLSPFVFEIKREASRRLLLTAVLVVAAIWVSEIFLQFLIWGSFPLPVDAQGNERLRLIPFLPWPNQPFWE
jgi:hypothetical protein